MYMYVRPTTRCSDLVLQVDVPKKLYQRKRLILVQQESALLQIIHSIHVAAEGKGPSLGGKTPN